MRASGGAPSRSWGSVEEESYANEACVEQDFSHEISAQTLCLIFRGLVPHHDLRIAPRTKLLLANEHRSRNLRSWAPRKVR